MALWLTDNLMTVSITTLSITVKKHVTQHNDTQQEDNYLNNAQHKNKKLDTQHNIIVCIIVLCIYLSIWPTKH